MPGARGEAGLHGAVSCDANEASVSVFCPSSAAADGAKCGTTPTVGLCLKKPQKEQPDPVVAGDRAFEAYALDYQKPASALPSSAGTCISS